MPEPELPKPRVVFTSTDGTFRVVQRWVRVDQERRKPVSWAYQLIAERQTKEVSAMGEPQWYCLNRSGGQTIEVPLDALGQLLRYAGLIALTPPEVA